MSRISILRRAGAHISAISPKRRIVPLLVAGVIAGALVGGQQDVALAHGNVPAHNVVASCPPGQVQIWRAEAYATYPSETVYWFAYLQRLTGSNWTTIGSTVGFNGDADGWLPFRSGPYYSSGYMGGLFDPYHPLYWKVAPGRYRVKSWFYWSATRTPSPVEYTGNFSNVFRDANGIPYCDAPL